MQDLPYFKAFPGDWEQAMRRADIPPEDRGDVYRLVFFAWADGGLKWEDETAMRRYAREMGWQWRRFSRTLAHYRRLCSPTSKRRLPLFLLRNLKHSLPEVSPEFGSTLPEVSSEFDQSLSEVSSEFEPSLPEVSPEFDAQNAPKSFGRHPVENTCQSQSHSQNQSQKAESEADAAPFDNFTDTRSLMAAAIATVMGLADVPEGDDAEAIYEAAEEFIAAGMQPSDVGEFEQDFYARKNAQGKTFVLTLKILRSDLPGWSRARRFRQSAGNSGVAEMPAWQKRRFGLT